MLELFFRNKHRYVRSPQKAVPSQVVVNKPVPPLELRVRGTTLPRQQPLGCLIAVRAHHTTVPSANLAPHYVGVAVVPPRPEYAQTLTQPVGIVSFLCGGLSFSASVLRLTRGKRSKTVGNEPGLSGDGVPLRSIFCPRGARQVADGKIMRKEHRVFRNTETTPLYYNKLLV